MLNRTPMHFRLPITSAVLAGLMILAGFLASPGIARADTYTVINTNDSGV